MLETGDGELQDDEQDKHAELSALETELQTFAAEKDLIRQTARDASRRLKQILSGLSDQPNVEF